jgi:glycogen(starch) synthase
MKVLMLGWELPPYNSGGLGEACLGLAKSLVEKGEKVVFVLPERHDLDIDFMEVEFADIKESVKKLQSSYEISSKWVSKYRKLGFTPYDFVNAAIVYAERIADIAKKHNPDVIHAHDWLTFLAGIEAKRVTKKPLVCHVHSTEYDRTGGHYPNPLVYEIEKNGLEEADKVIAISKLQKNILVRNYGIDSDKIEVVYNGATQFEKKDLPPALIAMKDLGYRVVLFLGRITLQKGPEYFVRAAKRVLEFEQKTIFVVTGSGDMQGKMIEEAASLGIMDNFIFTGFLRGDERDRIFQAADLYVMPSVSEPFGLTPLEAIANGAPVLISKQSGVSEVLSHALKVDFWDTDEMANKILAVIKYAPLKNDLQLNSHMELANITWDRSAEKCVDIYNRVVH